MAAVDGLVSGIDVTTIVSQLISVDSAQQTKLKTGVTTAQKEVSSYQSVNTKMQALQTAADNLKKATSWNPTTAKSSSDSVAVTAGSTASTGELSFNVTQLASTQSVVLNRTGGSGDGSFGTTESVDWSQQGFPLDVVKDGKVLGSISPTTGTISELAASINAASDLGVRAVAIKVADGKYKLQLTSATSGAAGAVSLLQGGGRAKGSAVSEQQVADNLSNNFTTIRQGQDARLDFGNGLVVTSSTNTFADIVPGVTVTATKADETQQVTVSVAPDTTKIADSMQALVDAANAALTEIGTQSKSGVAGSDGKMSASGALSGDSTLRGLQNSILKAVTSAFGSSSASTIGLQSTRDGKLTFDKDKFLTAYAADPAKVRQLVSPTSVDATAVVPGLAERLSTVAANATKAVSGSLTTAIEGRNSTIKDLTSRIADWDTRLAAKKERYQKYYSALEVSLGKLKNQSTWLAGQLSSLS